MRHTRILALAGLSTALLGTANAEIETSASAGYHSEYVYRGLNLGDDMIDFSLGFSGSTDIGDLNLGIWYGSWEGNVDEFRVEASVSRTIFDLYTVSAGLANHSFQGPVFVPGGAAFVPDLLEPFVGVSTSLGGIDLSAKAYFNLSDDDDEYDHEYYLEVGASYSVELAANLTGSLSADLGVWDTDPLFGVEDDVLFYSVTGALQYAASDNITLRAYITHSVSDDWVLEDETFGGASVSVSF
jgi:hypothetical protein